MKAMDRGFTLIEMLVAVTLSGVVGAVATTVIVQSFHQQAATDARTAVVAHVRAALQRTMRELRQADPLVKLTPDAAVLTDASTGRTLTYSVHTTNGVTSLLLDDGSTSTVVISNLVNDAADPVFSATPVAGYTPAVANTVDPYTCTILGVTPPEYAAKDCVGTVTVHLRVMPTDAAGRPLCGPTDGCVLDVQDDATMRNSP